MKKDNKTLEEIEVIDVFDELPKKVEQKKELKGKNKSEEKPKVKRKLKKGLLFQTIFCSISILFVIGCCVFYGSRLVKYYKIYNPKDENGKAIELLGSHVLKNKTFVYGDEEGIYSINGSHIFKGENVNNYIKFSNLLWRILRVNEDKSLDIILENPINNLKWNNTIAEYSKSDINMYLNDVFLKSINKDLITNSVVCKDIIDDVTKISCNEIDSSNYVRLLTIDEFLNTKVGEKTFVSNDSNIWLSSRGNKNAWTINGTSLSYAEVTNAYNIKPVVTLRNSNQIESGTGTKEEPYVIKEKADKIKVSDHIKLGEDIWTVYSIEKDVIRLSMSDAYKSGNVTYRFDLKSNKYNPENKSSLAKYLNEEFYNSLSYKDIIIESDWYIGEYNDSYKDIYSEKVTAKVGLSSIADLKLDSSTNYYYLANGTKDNKIYLYGTDLIESKVMLSRSIKPSICIKTQKIKSGTGTLTDPYILEA